MPDYTHPRRSKQTTRDPVPGITGSNDKDRYVVYPKMTKANYDRNQLQLHDPSREGPGWGT